MQDDMALSLSDIMRDSPRIPIEESRNSFEAHLAHNQGLVNPYKSGFSYESLLGRPAHGFPGERDGNGPNDDPEIDRTIQDSEEAESRRQRMQRCVP